MGRFALIILFYCGALHFIFAQTTVHGSISDAQTKKPVAASSVTIRNAGGKVVAFKMTDKEGLFAINLKGRSDSLFVEVNHLGYKRYRKGLNSGDLRIELEPSAILLEDVEVKSRPAMRRSGDTIAYNVEKFAQQEDRSIGDVIKRLPGMEVSANGQIKYQGKAISNFLIDGDNLLDDKYDIGTRTIRHDIVKDIHVMENHEMLKVMKGKRFSDEVAINLIIKDDAKLELTGEAKLGAGLPKLYDAEVNTHLFNKKIKTLNVLSVNSAGRDLSGDLTGFSAANTLAKLGTSTIDNLLSLGVVDAPPIEKSQYYLNHTGSLNINFLKNLKNDWQLKTNFQGLLDKNDRHFTGRTVYTQNDQEIVFGENQSAEQRRFLSTIKFTATKNLDNRFIQNDLTVDYADERATADILSGQGDFAVAQDHRIFGFTNRLQYAPELRNKDVIQINWFTNYARKPQYLKISPGVFPELLHQDQTYDIARQNVVVPQFFTDINTGYRFVKKKIKQYYALGSSFEYQHFQSDMELFQHGTAFIPDLDSTENNMHWNRSRTYLRPTYEIKEKRFQASLAFPLTYQFTSFKDDEYQLNNRYNQLLFNPSLSMTYRVKREDELSFNYNFSNSFGNISDVYRGIVIRNYRSISNNTSDLFETNSHNIGMKYNLSRVFQLFTANFGATYSRQNMNTIASNHISDQTSQTVFLPMKNHTDNYNLSTGFSKYILPIASTLGLDISWNRSNYNQLFNDDLLSFRNTSYNISPKIELKVWKQFKIAYTGFGSWMQADALDQPNTQLNNRVFQLSQNFGLPMQLTKKLFIRLNANHLYTKQASGNIDYIFFNSFVRYTIPKSRLDIELQLNNLANIRHFETYSVTSNMFVHNQYPLRGRMGILKVRFDLRRKP